MSASREEEAAKLFGDDVVPSAEVPPVAQTDARDDSPPTDFAPHVYHENTLDESIWATFKRDLLRIALNLRLVLLPFFPRKDNTRSLRNWDLWGPMLFTLLLAAILSHSNTESTSIVFTMSFLVMGLGAVILTLNVILMGGTIVFFQSLCLLGYCLFPLVLAAWIALMAKHWYVVWPITIAGVGWSLCAVYPFIREATPDTRRFMAMYPMVLLYLTVGWMIIVM